MSITTALDFSTMTQEQFTAAAEAFITAKTARANAARENAETAYAAAKTNLDAEYDTRLDALKATLAADLASAGVKPKGTPTGNIVAAKYRNPVTGETWSGRGLMPKWLVAELTKGAEKEAFAV